MRHEIQINLDCNDGARMVDFWSEALGYDIAGSMGQYRAVVDPDKSGPPLVFQEITEPRTTKNRMHLDLYFAGDESLSAERDRLIALGASVHPDGEIHEDNESWIVMRDPEGNEFCICHRDE